MNVALVYDRVNKIGGAERVLAALHQLWPDAPLYTAVYNPDTAPWADECTVIPSFLQRIPGASTHHELLPLLTPYAFESFDLSDYDVVISITSADAKAVITTPKQLHICYLLTPTRYLWSHREDYAGSGWRAAVNNFFMKRLANWDMVAASRPDAYVAISEAVAARCETYYKRPAAAVIYPPVTTKTFAQHPAKCFHPTSPYLLVVSRLVPYKRVDLAIQACNKLKQNLVVVGDGSERKRLESMAGSTIHFTGLVSDEHLACLYHHASGLLFPQEEEFGIVALEAQAAGIPVAAFNAGAAAEIIKDGVTGALFPKQSVASLEQGINALINHTWYDKTIQEHALQFDQLVFRNRFKAFVEETWQHHQPECGQ